MSRAESEPPYPYPIILAKTTPEMKDYIDLEAMRLGVNPTMFLNLLLIYGKMIQEMLQEGKEFIVKESDGSHTPTHFADDLEGFKKMYQEEFTLPFE